MLKNDLAVAYVDPATLVPYVNNTKIHDDAQINQIAESILRFGFNDPIGIDEHNNVIEGHGRLLAALRLGIKSVPVIVISGLTQEEQKAYSMVHNKLTLNSDFDMDIVAEELDGITNIDMGAFGFFGEESFFDPDSEYEKKVKGEIVATVGVGQSDEIREWLDNQLFDYVEKLC